MSSPAFFLQAALVLWLIFPYPQEPKFAGEILEISCSAEFKKTNADKEEPLDPKHDRGRKLYAKELYRCKDKGVLKLRVYDRDVNVKPEMEWYPIPEASDGDSKDTGGRPYEELAWMRGTYQLKSYRNEGSSEQVKAIVAGVNALDGGRYAMALDSQLSPPKNLSIDSNGRLVTFAYSPTGSFAFSADGTLQSQQLPDGSKWELKASIRERSIFIDWKLEDKVRSDITVESKPNGEILITRKTFVSNNPNPLITRMSYVRTLATSPFRKSFAEERLVTEELVTELMEPIDSKKNGTFVLRVKEPTQVSGATIRGHFFKTFWNVDKGFTLVMEVKSIEVPTGGNYDIRGIVEKISAQDGTKISFTGPEYPNAAERFLDGLKPAKASGTSIVTSSSSPLDKDITIPKGTVFVLKALINKQ